MAVSTEANFLLLSHAFERLGCLRVEFLTDVLNSQSRAAIARLGARQEGVLRHHMVMPDGRHRDSACYSIVQPEWPSVKAALEAKLGEYGEVQARRPPGLDIRHPHAEFASLLAISRIRKLSI